MIADTSRNFWYTSVLMNMCHNAAAQTEAGVSFCVSWRITNMSRWHHNSSTCTTTCVSESEHCSPVSTQPCLSLCKPNYRMSRPVTKAGSTYHCRWWFGWWSRPRRNAWWGWGALQMIQALSAQSGCASWALLCWLFHPQGSLVPTSAATPSG